MCMPSASASASLGLLVLFDEHVAGAAAVSGGECFFLALATFAGRHCGDVDSASAQLNLQPQENSWVAECDVLWMPATVARDFDVGIAVPQC
jgi:hypothetical protein